MTGEDLESTIEDIGVGFGNTQIRVDIRAGGDREDDFDAVREAVKRALDGDEHRLADAEPSEQPAPAPWVEGDE